MSICYQCGHEMVSERHYEDPKDKFITKPKFIHSEHIIQNALYGKLQASNVLCKQCGADFSEKTDKDFVSIFQMITETVPHRFIPKDHGKGSINTLKGYLYESDDSSEKRDVYIRENIVSPKEPFYQYDEHSRKVKIYANKVRAKHYKQVVIKKLKAKGVEDAESLSYETIEDISQMGVLGIFFSEGMENFHQKFTMGFIKIAVGFATHHGVKREYLKSALKIDEQGKGTLINEGNVFPFFPIGALDEQLELSRPDIEKHYPSHTLILFSQDFEGGRKQLFCYVDLFSTFQYYVLLSDDYRGENLYQVYYQAIAKEEKENKKVNVRDYTYKEHNILISEYQIEVKKYHGPATDMEGYLDFLQQQVDEYTTNPKLDLESAVGDRLKFVMNSYTTAHSGHLRTAASESIRAFPPNKKRILLHELHQYFKYPKDGLEFYRRHFTKENELGKLERNSTPDACASALGDSPIRLLYCTKKFEQMSQWLFEHRIVKED